MNTLTLIGRWLLAFVATASSIVVAVLFFIFLGLGLAGVPVGGPMPGDYVSSHMPAAQVYIVGSLCLTLMIGTLVGVASAPYRHRRIAAVVFPALLISGIFSGAIAHPTTFVPGVLDIPVIASSVIVGAFFYIRHSQAQAKNGKPP